MRLTLALLAVVGVATGLSGVVGGSVRALDGAESVSITGGCIDNAFCNAGNNNCEGYNFFFGNLRTCPSGDGTCWSCTDAITTGGCQGTGSSFKCRYPGETEECGFRSDGTCSGSTCNDSVTTTECVDMPKCETKSGTCPW